MCSGERSSSANGAIALRQSAARSWSTSSSRVLSDWTMRGPSFIFVRGPRGSAGAASGLVRSSCGGVDGLLPGAVGGDVGAGGAAIGAVAAGLVGRGVDVDVGAR